jgi:hypothetical protein
LLLVRCPLEAGDLLLCRLGHLGRVTPVASASMRKPLLLSLNVAIAPAKDRLSLSPSTAAIGCLSVRLSDWQRVVLSLHGHVLIHHKSRIRRPATDGMPGSRPCSTSVACQSSYLAGATQRVSEQANSVKAETRYR